MKLYHFTGGHHVAGVQRDGLTQGGVPMASTNGRRRSAPGWRWLTDDPSWSQGWATMETIDCDRTEYRLEVVIPKTARARLYHWPAVAHKFGITGPLYAQFDREGGGGSDHWYIFAGRVPPAWLRGLEQRPAVVELVR